MALVDTFRLRRSLPLFVALVATLAMVTASASADPPPDQPESSNVVEGVAASPPVVNFQGRLVDPATGSPKNGTFAMSFRLYDVASGGTALWTESKNVVVSNGLFTTLLGDTTALVLTYFDGRDLWLGVQVASDLEATPRMPVTYAPYALHASDAANLGGQPSSAFAAASHNHSAANITSGTLSTGRYSAYSDLGAEGYLGDAAGDLAQNNGALQATLNADLLDGQQASAFAAASHVHSGAEISDGTLDTVDLADGAVTPPKISTAGAAEGQALVYEGGGVAWAAPSGVLLQYTVLDAECSFVPAFGTTYVKVVDIGSIYKVHPDSLLEVTFNGRIYVESFSGATGASFELRVGDMAASVGRARASLRAAEAGGEGMPASMLGLYSGLGPGWHTVSIWVEGAFGTGTYAGIDPGCWDTDHVVVREVR